METTTNKTTERCTPEQVRHFLATLLKQCDERGLQLHTVHVTRNDDSGDITNVRLSYTETY